MKKFWDKLPKPFFCLAPMADVTDAAFRRMFAKYGKPDVTWTEFVSADGLVSEGRKVLKYDLLYSEKERPIVAQLFSSNPTKMHEAAKLCADLGFDGIDINMGCPDRSIEKQGAGAAMMKDMKKAGEIIKAVKDGIKDSKKKNAQSMSVSVKTRIGYNKNQISEWIPFLLSQDIDALTLHARTRKEMSLVPARWDHVKEVVGIRNKMGVKTKIIGNGDVKSLEDGIRLAEETGCDGIMVGRAVFGNPWFFGGERPCLKGARGKASRSQEISIKEKLKVLVEHTKLYDKLLGKVKNFAVMKKHYKAYVNGFDGAKELRVKLMDASSAKEVETIIKEFLKTL
ncbi:MAG: tRNA-dihydrouridine synthase [Candidatus Nomurabacteria bacterium GW2011_GWF2_35_66]|uniref:tRNA-dihydrouridine synthase n=1 Tax=Candidatus Nomurabacteria bacterium GW2011_GWE1_35_16 TaxID=1618761 RepID=A0A0G0BRW7_9BACT|nr:MAG: tRNA-dihydrouridine synthase [Candidatus Nomurabacteria bacterium GW2011_GWF1_34_20]KKP62992.1 MAG: tRNA-dihydrouridine synthase [Candidatus Nomurabacteria bacterium GW2011_GWE2_34_25]KKP66396.1 MAG: tRNA-dihydrouridine synthase [Candidatus Nomurabacteria bacterium GW2011_GWE1_35_16]KKP83164.1 MAG: tRNA-dihydrouridine synthase [Candidatus Nomurabacteria bacterium GW2011_GWF2_35_66]HAE36512.1 tRNA-dihydrouridine synthase [Candidatus Nomurabacteria bacterium]